MAEKSGRRRMLEVSLAEDPQDTFLQYGLAVQCLREGDLAEGRARLRALIAAHPDDEIAAYRQLGLSYLETGEGNLAQKILRTGIAKARAKGHAASEIAVLLNETDA